MILVYVTCESVKQAKQIGKAILKKRLATCVNIFPEMQPIFWWPPKKNKLDESKEVVLIIKTIEKKFKEIEKEILQLHTYETPCIFSIKVDKVHKPFLDWIEGEIR